MNSSSSSYQPTSRPQQYGMEQQSHRGILRETPPSARGQRIIQSSRSSQRTTPRAPALVLDAAASSSSVSLISHDSSVTTPRGPIQRFLDRPPPPQTVYMSPSESTTTTTTSPQETAAWFARQAPQAGYLQKLGANVPEFKRRFFVLHPGTHLYYFLSPTDHEPRGCLDLEGSWMEQVGELSDGRYRFAICWKERKVILEARSKIIAEEWMQRLEEERLSYCKTLLGKTQRKNSALTSRIGELEQQVANYKLVEKDRDGALEDAARWKREFEKLDEYLRRLTQQLRQTSSFEENKPKETKEKIQDKSEQEENSEEEASVKNSDEKKEESKEIQFDGDEEKKETEENSKGAPAALQARESPIDVSRESSLLDEAVQNEEAMIDMMNVPGTHFGALYNVCEQLRDNLRLASQEASTAVEDLNAANEKVATVEKRMSKAEKHICKLWEENCSIRKALKQKKREKRVLVREYKNLLEAAKAKKVDDLSEGMPPDDGSSMIGSEEERLINELEEHVMSSIHLHEQYLATSGTPRPFGGASPSATPSTSSRMPNNVSQRSEATVRIGQSQPRPTPQDPPSTKGTQGKALLSLFDESDDESDSDDDAQSAAISLSSINVEASDSENQGLVDEGIVVAPDDEVDESQDGTPERKNPLAQLDEDDDQPNLCAASTQSESSKSVMNPGNATSKLACPLADVVGTKNTHSQSTLANEELQVYHLTFYSRKIGLQFQKVPPPPVKPKGLLTDAMITDLAGVPTGSGKTAAELRRIASISNWAKSADSRDNDEVCRVASPVDAVLICGFNGFDDSGSNVRPKLGARLVAFDGVSVEVGKWTFDSIRKAIQARGRPLTLSFRNDFLTTEQRTILTKAVKDTQTAFSPPLQHGPPIQSQANSRPPSAAPSEQSAISHETDHFINESRTPRYQEDDLSTSAPGSDYRSSFPPSFSGGRSVGSGNFRSFSEAGSSASVLSAVAPLVANLLHNRSEPFTPEYMRREPESVEDTPQHQDFKSELL